MKDRDLRDRRAIFCGVTLVFVLFLGLAVVFRLSLFFSLVGIVIYLAFFAVAVFVQNSALFVPIFVPDRRVGRFVALTFDDGPHPINTPKVLDILDRHQVRATFFCAGKNVEKYPGLTERIHRSGHQIANHTYSHPLLISFYSRRRLKTELLRGEESISSSIGNKPRFFRQVAGVVNPQLGDVMGELDLVLVGWDVRLGDLREKKAQPMVGRAVARVRSGSILLLHDGSEPCVGGRDGLLQEALPLLIDGIRECGFEFATVADLYDRHISIPAFANPDWEGRKRS
jgi:peptidoglycan/xylan/chitin deacetylase (PgdA/CDA1 family)